MVSIYLAFVHRYTIESTDGLVQRSSVSLIPLDLLREQCREGERDVHVPHLQLDVRDDNIREASKYVGAQGWIL